MKNRFSNYHAFFLVAAIALTVACAAGESRKSCPQGTADYDTEDTDSGSGSDSATDAGVDTSTWDMNLDMDCSDCPGTGGTVTNMVCAIDICDIDVVLTSQIYCAAACEEVFEAIEHYGDAANDIGPLLNGSYAVMGTGDPFALDHNRKISYTTPVVYDPFVTTENIPIRDVVVFELGLVAPLGAVSFSFNYVFFSAEYDEYISSFYNDKFYAILEADSTNGGEPTVINFTPCRSPSLYSDFVCTDSAMNCELNEKYCYLSINNSYSECCWYPHCSSFIVDSCSYDPCPGGFTATDITGTGFSCAASVIEDDRGTGSSTGWLRTTWPIEGGEQFKLTFHIHDAIDTFFDSAVVIDAFEFHSFLEDIGTIDVE
jgi:hypothetical protein